MSPPCSSALLAALVGLVGCTLQQDLGRDGTGDDPTVALSTDTHTGFGAGWACPEPGTSNLFPVARELACPMTKPIAGDACPYASTPPCVFDEAHTACICNSDHRWSCVEGIWFRTLSIVPVEGETCVAGIEVASPCAPGAINCEISCQCVDGTYRCAR